MKIFISIITLFFILISDGYASEKLIITGSSTIAPLVNEIAKRFESLHKGIRIDVQTGGSSRGISDAAQGTADIGMVSRSLKSDESYLKSFTIAKDGICLIVHKSNPIQKLTNEQIVAIFTGKIKNWKKIGGPNKEITVVNKAEGRSTLELFLQYFKIKPQDIDASVIIGDNEQGIKTVAGNPGAIGYVSIGTAEYSFSNNVSIKLLPIEGVNPSTINVKNGTFPLSRSLNLVTKSVPTGLIKTFIDYVQSPQINDLIQKQYFVPIAK